ncbi:MAG: helix-turn-helix domain-containing protein [Aureispira sp.]|nr:helix-turn-helix domain-containing protein [Aureispira sp.]
MAKTVREPDLIVSDLMMPEMDGFDLLKHIKNDHLFCRIPLIMLTARAGQNDKLTALTIGVDSYLTKPFVTEELLAQVANTLYNYHQRKNWASETNTEQPKNAQQTKETIKSSSNQLSLEDLDWIKRVESYTSKNLSNSNFNSTQLFLEMNMTDRTFRRKLKRITGMSPVKYIRELRLQAARELLELKKYNSIQQVCTATGFGTPHYFTKQFKARFGKVPTEYLD